MLMEARMAKDWEFWNGELPEDGVMTVDIPGATTKPSNPKDAIGVAKVSMSMVPSGPIMEAAMGMFEGSCKYGRHNYRAVGVRASVYYDAVFRHLTAWWEGEDIDPASNIHHIGKAIASLIVVRDSMMRGNWTDDRPPKMAPGWQEPFNTQARFLLDKYPAPEAPWTQDRVDAERAVSGVQEAFSAPPTE